MTRAIAAAILSMLIGSAAYADDSVRKKAERLSQLRIEVDELAGRLEAERKQARAGLESLTAERRELERQTRLEAVRAETLEKIESEHRARADGLEGASLARIAPVRRAIASAKTYVTRSLPFHRAERTKQLDRIEASLAVEHPDASRALSRLWRFVEEEEALAREVGRSQQPIEFGGQRQLVDVARIGMALLYIRTAEQRYGWAKRDGDAWTYVPVEGAARDAVALIFEALDANRTYGPQPLLVPELTP